MDLFEDMYAALYSVCFNILLLLFSFGHLPNITFFCFSGVCLIFALCNFLDSKIMLLCIIDHIFDETTTKTVCVFFDKPLNINLWNLTFSSNS